MATKKTSSPAIAEIEKKIAALTAQLHKARTQKIIDGEKALKLTRAAVATAATQVNRLETKGAGKAEVKKAKHELAHLEQRVVTIEAELSATTTALEIAAETTKLLLQPTVKTTAKKTKVAARTEKLIVVKPQTKNNKTTTPSSIAKVTLPQAKPVLREVIGTTVTMPSAPESSVLPEHGTTKMIEPRDNPLPKPMPV